MPLLGTTFYPWIKTKLWPHQASTFILGVSQRLHPSWVDPSIHYHILPDSPKSTFSQNPKVQKGRLHGLNYPGLIKDRVKKRFLTPPRWDEKLIHKRG